jgi:hypothetical protein
MTNKRFTPNSLYELNENEIFVFGSNEAGIHGAGAAKLAYLKFGATYGVGYGLMGQSFAIPTKNKKIKTLPLDTIEKYIIMFLEEAKTMPDLTFLVTKIGCGLAGYKENQIKPFFKNIPDNVILPKGFH